MSAFPRLGLGTYRNSRHERCARSVETALNAGYRHVDTAQLYDSEPAVGGGIERADVDCEAVFLATKVWRDSLRGVLASPEKLGVDYVDLLYVHWPAGTYDPPETLRAFDELRAEGLVRNAGVSNSEPRHLDEARDLLDAPVSANQVEMHPLLQQEELLGDAREHDRRLVAYAPLARGAVLAVPELQAVAEKHDATPAQVSLAWLLSKDGVAAVPKATGADHILENHGALSLDLDDEDVARVDAVDREQRVVDFDAAPWNRA